MDRPYLEITRRFGIVDCPDLNLKNARRFQFGFLHCACQILCRCPPPELSHSLFSRPFPIMRLGPLNCNRFGHDPNPYPCLTFPPLLARGTLGSTPTKYRSPIRTRMGNISSLSARAKALQFHFYPRLSAVSQRSAMEQLGGQLVRSSSLLYSFPHLALLPLLV